MMDGKEREEVVRLATKIAFGMWNEMQSGKTEYITRRMAKKKYKMLLWEWEARGLVKAIHTEGGKHDVFPKHRLEELYMIHTYQI